MVGHGLIRLRSFEPAGRCLETCLALACALVRAESLRFGVRGAGFRVWGPGFGVWGLRFRFWGSEFGVWGLGFGVQDLGFRV